MLGKQDRPASLGEVAAEETASLPLRLPASARIAWAIVPNLLPLVGILWLHWDVLNVALSYWGACVGLLVFCAILQVRGDGSGQRPELGTAIGLFSGWLAIFLPFMVPIAAQASAPGSSATFAVGPDLLVRLLDGLLFAALPSAAAAGLNQWWSTRNLPNRAEAAGKSLTAQNVVLFCAIWLSMFGMRWLSNLGWSFIGITSGLHTALALWPRHWRVGGSGADSQPPERPWTPVPGGIAVYSRLGRPFFVGLDELDEVRTFPTAADANAYISGVGRPADATGPEAADDERGPRVLLNAHVARPARPSDPYGMVVAVIRGPERLIAVDVDAPLADGLAAVLASHRHTRAVTRTIK